MTVQPDFTLIEGRVHPVRADAIGFALPLEALKWIPLSLIHPDDRAQLKAMEGTTARLRIRTWKAEQLGLLAKPGAQDGDLFDGGRPL